MSPRLEALAEQRRQTIEALHRKVARLEAQLARRDARLAQIQTEATALRRQIRRIVTLATRGRLRRPNAPRERAVGE